jgi:hypothetical protein
MTKKTVRKTAPGVRAGGNLTQTSPKGRKLATAKRSEETCPLPPMTDARCDNSAFYVAFDGHRERFEAIAFSPDGKLWHWDKTEWKPISLADSAQWYADIEQALTMVDSGTTIQSGRDYTDWFERVAAQLDLKDTMIRCLKENLKEKKRKH